AASWPSWSITANDRLPSPSPFGNETKTRFSASTLSPMAILSPNPATGTNSAVLLVTLRSVQADDNASKTIEFLRLNLVIMISRLVYAKPRKFDASSSALTHASSECWCYFASPLPPDRAFAGCSVRGDFAVLYTQLKTAYIRRIDIGNG